MKLHQKKRNKKGFTLAELLVVIAILTIVLAIAVPNFAPFMRRIQLMELDDSAHSIFMAAQSKLTAMYSVGADLTFGDKAGKISTVPEIYLSVTEHSGEDAENEAGTVDADMRYLKYTGGKNESYDNIFSGTSVTNVSSIESQIYNGNYIIEYDAQTGFVYGVFYAEDDGKAEIDNYDAESADSIEREFDARLETMVGFYGGGTLEEYTPGAKVPVPEIEWCDLEKLVLYVKWPEQEDAVVNGDKLYFSVTIQALDDKKEVLEGDPIEIVPSYDYDDPNKGYYITKNSKATIILDSLAPCQGSDGGQWNLPDTSLNLNPNSNQDLSGFVLERDFKGWTLSYNNRAGYDNLALESMWAGGTYPPYQTEYAINPGANFRATVTFYDPNNVEMKESSYVDLNSYFDCKNTDLSKHTAAISAGRHLQNLANYVDGDLITRAEMFSSIDFSADLSGTEDCYKAWNSSETYKGNAGNERSKYLYDFKPIGSQFTEESKFLTEGFHGHYSDKGYMIKYLRINNDPEIHPEYRPNNSSFDIYNFTGFFTNLYNSSGIEDICFYCPVVKGYGEYTGLFYGYGKGGLNLKNMTVINPIVEGPGYVGGFVGAETGGGNLENWKISVEKVEDGYFDNNFDNNNYPYKNDNREGDINWGNPDNDPYKRFFIRGTSEYKASAVEADSVPDAKNAGPFAGGLLGYSNNSVHKFSAAIRIESEGYAGGLIGYGASIPTMDACYVAGHTYNGKFIGTQTLDGCDYVLRNITGKKGAGGLVGYATSNPGVTNNTYTTCSVSSDDSNKVDTIVGYVEGGSRDYGQDSVYSIGCVIDSDEPKILKVGSYSSNVKTYGPDILSAGREVPAEPYDDTLPEAYPYASGVSLHKGDWPLNAIFGVFYWEEDDGGNIYIKALGYDPLNEKELDFDNLDTNPNKVISWGYGYFYGDSINANTEMMAGLGGAPLDNGRFKTQYDKIKKILSEQFGGFTYMSGRVFDDSAMGAMTESERNQIVHGLQSITLNCDFERLHGSHKRGSRTYIFNPDFCGLSESQTLGVRNDNNEAAEEPYRIRSVGMFKNIKNSLSSSFVQDKNLQFTEELVPIGTLEAYFSGRYNGNSKTTTLQDGLTIDGKVDGNGYGIFGVARSANLKNIKAVYNTDNGIGTGKIVLGDPDGNSQDSAKNGIGGIVGIVIGGSIDNCYVDGFMVEVYNGYNTAVGGIAGYSSATINNSYVGVGDSGTDVLFEEDSRVKISISNKSGGKETDVAAAGGIAGSANGNITGCAAGAVTIKISAREIKGYDAAKTATDYGPLVIGGGIVGNNLDFTERSHLEVNNCTSKASIARNRADLTIEGPLVYYGNMNPSYKINNPALNERTVIHPIAPDYFKIDIFSEDYNILRGRKKLTAEKDFSNNQSIEFWMDFNIANREIGFPDIDFFETEDTKQTFAAYRSTSSHPHDAQWAMWMPFMWSSSYEGPHYIIYNRSEGKHKYAKTDDNNVLVSLDVEDAYYPRIYQFITGTGVLNKSDKSKDNNIFNLSSSADADKYIIRPDTVISNCTAYVGKNYYNSLVWGESASEDGSQGVKIIKIDDPDTGMDCYARVLPGTFTSVTSNAKKAFPAFGIYSLYEKTDANGNSSIIAKSSINSDTTAYDSSFTYDATKNPKNTEKPSDGGNYSLDPLYRYGVLVSLGSMTDLDITVGGNAVSNIPGTAYLKEDGNSLTYDKGYATPFFDFSDVLVTNDNISKETQFTIKVRDSGDKYLETASKSDNKAKSAKITVPARRAPYTGVYQLWNKANNGGSVISGIYSNYSTAAGAGKKDNKMPEPSSGAEKAYKFGVMLEHSTIAPRSLDEIKVVIVYKDSDGKTKELEVKKDDLSYIGTDYTMSGGSKAKAYGKVYEYYEIKDSVIAKMPEGIGFTIKVSTADGKTELSKGDFTTEIKKPYLGLYGVHGVRYNYSDGRSDDKNVIQYVLTRDNKEVETVNEVVKDSYAASQEDIETDLVFGVLLEKGYDKNNLTVEFSAGKKAVTIEGSGLKEDEETYVDAKDQYGANFSKVYNGKTLVLYKISYDQIPDGATAIKVTYKKDGGYTASADIVEDLGGKVKHTPCEWKSDEDYHWRECEDPDCPNKGDKLDYGKHTAGEWKVVKQPTKDSPGLKEKICTVCGKQLEEEEISVLEPGKYGTVGLGRLYYDDSGWPHKQFVNAKFFGKDGKEEFAGKKEGNPSDFVLILDNYYPFKSYSISFIKNNSDGTEIRDTKTLSLIEQFENAGEFEGYSVFKVDNFQYEYEYAGYISVEVSVDGKVIGTYQVSDWSQE